MKLSEHFSRAEFERSDRAARLGIPNTMTPEALENAKRLCRDVLEPLRAALGRPIRITSGYRSDELNAATPGSSKTSAHREGRAVDIVVEGLTNADVMAALLRSTIPFDQAIDEGVDRGGKWVFWVHVQVARGGQRPRRERLTFRTGEGYRLVGAG